MQYKLICIIFLIFIFQKSFSANWILLDSTKISNEKCNHISIDKYINLYVSDINGLIYKLDSLGKQQLIYSPSKVGEVNNLDAWNSIHIFVFYRDYQSYTLIDRFLTRKDPVRLPAEDIGFARIMTIANDQNYWLLDEGDFSLKKIGYYSHQILVRTPLDLLIRKKQTDFNILREYQNQVFLVDAISGIYIFDNMANFKRKILFKNKIEAVTFDKDVMYVTSGDSIYENNIYKINTEKQYIKPSIEVNSMVKYNQTYYFIKNNYLYRYLRN